MAKKEKGTRQKKKKGRSTQELLGIKTFTKYGLAMGKYELFRDGCCQLWPERLFL